MARERRTNEKHNLPPGVERIRDKYRARLPRLPGDPGSGRYRKGSPTPDLWRAAKEAQEARERYDKALAGHKVQRGEWTLAKAMAAVLDECDRKGNKPATVRCYREHFRVLKRVWPNGMAPLRSISVEQVEHFKNERGMETVPGTDRRLSATTVCHELQILSRCFEVAIKRGYQGLNPVKNVTRPRVRQAEPDYFVRSEVLAILERIRSTPMPRVDGDVDADLLLLLFTTAIRRSEAARLKVGDINFERGTMTVDGKKRVRTLPVPKQMAPLLKRIISWPEKSYERTSRNLAPLAGKGPAFKGGWTGEGGDRYLFPGETEDDRVGFVKRTFQRWQRKLKEPRLHPHAMRHSFTTHLYSCGYSMEFVSALAGHEKETRNAAHRYHRVLAPDRIRGMEMLWKDPPTIEDDSGEEVA